MLRPPLPPFARGLWRSRSERRRYVRGSPLPGTDAPCHVPHPSRASPLARPSRDARLWRERAGDPPAPPADDERDPHRLRARRRPVDRGPRGRRREATHEHARRRGRPALLARRADPRLHLQPLRRGRGLHRPRRWRRPDAADVVPGGIPRQRLDAATASACSTPPRARRRRRATTGCGPSRPLAARPR